ncbi:hypothetical protein [Neptunitalea chrysea]|nr:hypothetical protein [Neptunitalea chrysea]
MNSITLLYINRNTEIYETIKRVISRPKGQYRTVVQTDDEAKKKF